MKGLTLDTAFAPATTEELFALSDNQGLAYVKVTPTLAENLLSKYNKTNRPLSAMTVRKYAQEMNKKTWHAGVTDIKFSYNCDILDGQHRLAAVRDSGEEIIFSFSFNLDPASFAVLDTGKKRSGSDTLVKAGFSNTTVLASMLRKYLHYTTRQGNMWSIGTPCSNEQMLDIAEANPDFARHASFVDAHKAVREYGAKSDFGTCYAIFSKIDPVVADEFMQLVFLKNQFQSNGNDYTLLFSSLRQQLVRNKGASHKTGQGKKDPHDAESRTFWLMFDAWNAFMARENREINSRKINRERFIMIQKWPARQTTA